MEWCRPQPNPESVRANGMEYYIFGNKNEDPDILFSVFFAGFSFLPSLYKFVGNAGNIYNQGGIVKNSPYDIILDIGGIEFGFQFQELLFDFLFFFENLGADVQLPVF
jgi:hypothetical protein